MNREIKFKFLTSEGWKYFTLEELSQGTYTGVEIDNGKEKSRCQFTGFKDKNGKEIYEGDIFTEGQIKIESFGTVNFVVVWHKKFGQWGFSQPHHPDKKLRGVQPFYYNGSFYDSIRFEIIGNIYENPK